MNDHSCPSGPSSSSSLTVAAVTTSSQISGVGESNTANMFFRGSGNRSAASTTATSTTAVQDISLSAPVQNRASYERKRKVASETTLAEHAQKTVKYEPGDFVVPPDTYPLLTMAAAINRSWVWNHFKKINVKNAAVDVLTWGDTHASCNICNAAALVDATVKWYVPYTSQHSPGHLERHIQHSHNEIIIEKRVALAADEKNGKCITSYFKKHPDFEESYLKWAVHTYQPLNTIEGKKFRRMCKSLSSDAPEMTANHVKKSLLQVQENIKQGFRKKFEDQYIAITLDHWTSASNVNFAAQTAHFIDEDFKLQVCTLACTVHSGGSSGDDSKRVIQQLNIFYVSFCIFIP